MNNNTLAYTDKDMNKILVIEKLNNKLITLQQASTMIGCHERTIYRYKKSISIKGTIGIIHGLKGKPSNNKSNVSKLDNIIPYLKQKRFASLTPTMVQEKLELILGYKVNRETLRKLMIKLGLWLPNKKKYKVTKMLRERKEKYGIMIQFDGSYHDWLGDGTSKCLLLAIDDATSKIVYMRFSDGEGFDDITQFRKEYMYIHGKPQVLYLDRHASYKVNHIKDQFDTQTLTRFSRGMSRLNVGVIHANSPEAKGRVERSFRTLQTRLVKELMFRGIDNYHNANMFLDDYKLEYNTKFGKVAKQDGDEHIRISEKDKECFDWIFGYNDKRKIKNNGSLSYKNKVYVIKRGTILNKGRIIDVMESIKGEIRLYSGDKELQYEKI